MLRFCVTARTNRPSRVRVSSSHDAAARSAAKAMITMRLHGSTTLVMISMPPDIHDGFSTCTFCAPKIVRTAWIRMRLMPQVASSVSSGRPYRKRMTVRSSTMPTSAADERTRPAPRTSRYQSNAPGSVLPEQVLHDVRRVRADHDQLAVRHVDDAHQAVGDREAERREQQDACRARCR